MVNVTDPSIGVWQVKCEGGGRGCLAGLASIPCWINPPPSTRAKRHLDGGHDGLVLWHCQTCIARVKAWVSQRVNAQPRPPANRVISQVECYEFHFFDEAVEWEGAGGQAYDARKLGGGARHAADGDGEDEMEMFHRAIFNSKKGLSRAGTEIGI